MINWFLRLPKAAQAAIHCLLFILIFFGFTRALQSIGIDQWWKNDLITAVGTALGVFYLRIADFLSRAQQTAQQRIYGLKSGRQQIHPLLAVIYTFALLQLTINVVQALLSFAVGYALGYVIIQTSTTSESVAAVIEANAYQALQAGVAYPPVLTLVVFTVPIAVFVAHRVRRLAVLWTASGLVLSMLFSLTASYLLGQTDDLIITRALVGYYGLVYILLLLAAVIGGCWARRTQDDFVMMRVFRHLSPLARQALIELADEELGQRHAENVNAHSESTNNG